jgi:hypothetical protein
MQIFHPSQDHKLSNGAPANISQQNK